MPTRPTIPPAGSPVAPPALLPGPTGPCRRGRPPGLARRGLVGQDGALGGPPPQVSIGLFQITDLFTNNALPDGQQWPFSPSTDWYWAPATRIEYYGQTTQNWNTPAGESDASTTPERRISGPPQPCPTAAGVQNEWVWCFYDEGPGPWVILAQAPPRWTYYGDAPSSQTFTAGNYLAEITAPAATLPHDGTYLVAYQATLQNTDAGSGPPVCRIMANLYANHALRYAYDLQQSHLHPPTSPTGANAWTVTIPIGAIDGTHPAAPVTLDLPAAGPGAGQISWAERCAPPNQNNILTVRRRLDSTATRQYVNLTLTVVLLGP